MKYFATLCLLLLVPMAMCEQLRWRLAREADEFGGSSSADTDRQSAHYRRRSQHFAAKPMESLKHMIQKGYQAWKEFKLQFGKAFEGETVENTRMLTFLTAKQFIDDHNEKFARKEVSFELGVNSLADLSFDEYMKLNGYRRVYGDALHRNSSRFLAPHNVDVPDSWDWRDHGYVTDVKNQGMCGSCWAFSATGSLEGQHKKATGTLTSLSEQNLVDCSVAYGNNGCNGGLMDFAFQYIKANHGIDTETSYPYKARQKKCHFQRSTVGAEDTGFVDLPEGDEEKLKIAVATQGPISVAIDAGHRSFQLYQHGVYFEKECSPDQLDHGVLVVGYGTDPAPGQGDYWIVKNSWATTWGEEGYIRMARNRDNHCGIASKASYPLV